MQQPIRASPITHPMYDTPPLYLALHVLMGAAFVFAPLWLTLAFLLYQAAQWAMDRRFFLFSLELKQGNSLPYTLYKVGQLLAGYGAAALALRVVQQPRGDQCPPLRVAVPGGLPLFSV